MFNTYIIFENKELKQQLAKILNQLQMANETLQELKNRIAGLEQKADAAAQSLSNIGGDIARIKEGLPEEGGLSAAEVGDLRTSLDGLEAKVNGFASAAESLDKENEAPVVTDPGTGEPGEEQPIV